MELCRKNSVAQNQALCKQKGKYFAENKNSSAFPRSCQSIKKTTVIVIARPPLGGRGNLRLKV